MTDPRAVTVTLAGIRSLTILEVARASAIAGVRQGDARRLLRSLNDPAGDPADVELAATLLYAWALMLERRAEPGLTWEQAQTWRVVLELGSTDPIAEAEAEATVAAALMTGLPPDVAGGLTLAQAEQYGQRGRELERAVRGR